MATLNPVIIPAKVLRNGKHKIRISVAHNGETRYIVTNIVIDSLSEFKNGSITRRPDAAMLNTKLRGLLQDYQKIIDEMPYADGFSCPELVSEIKTHRTKASYSLNSVFDEYIAMSKITQSSQTLYKTLWECITRLINGDMPIANVTSSLLIRLDKELSKGRRSATVRNHMVLLKSVVTYATRSGYAQFRIDPFLGYKLPVQTIRNAWLSVEDIKAIRDLKINNEPRRRYRDLFMLSYYLGGMNIADLKKINFNETNGNMCYVRTKTMKKNSMPVMFKIPDEAQIVIDRLKTKSGHVTVKSISRETQSLNNALKRIATDLGLGYTIYYSARKSFSQHAFDLGIPTQVIDYILGHSIGNKSIYNYVRVTPAAATEAIRKVLDNLK